MMLHDMLRRLLGLPTVPNAPAADPAEVARLAHILETWEPARLEELAARIRGDVDELRRRADRPTPGR